MTEQKQERPAALTRRPVQPAPDAKVDPIDPPKPPAKQVVARAAKQGTLAYEAPAPKQVEPDYNLSTRISAQVRATLRKVTNSGISQRAAIEHAIMHTYGQEGKKT